MKNLPKIFTQNRSRSILPEGLRAKRSLFEISTVFIPSGVTVILSRMHNICLKPVQLVGGVVTCVVRFIVVLYCHTGHTYLSYLFVCRDYRKHCLIG